MRNFNLRDFIKSIPALLAAVLLIAAFIALRPIEAQAEAYTSGYFTYTVTDGEATVTDCDPSAGSDIQVPATLDGYPVTGVGECAFSLNDALISVSLPDSVTDIAYYAFGSCHYLQSIDMPDNLQSIGAAAFYNCNSLQSITIPAGVTKLSGGYDTFYQCYALKSVNITDIAAWCGMEFDEGHSSACNPIVGADLYLNGTLVEDLVIPDTVTEIAYYAFYGCTSLTSVSVPESVQTIGGHAFADCADITQITVSEGVDDVGNYAFRNCTGLMSVALPDSVTRVGYGAFEGCTNLIRVTMADNVTTVGASAFSGCKNLAKVTLSKNLTKISGQLFYDCSSLSKVSIPDGVKAVDYSAFAGCSSLSDITIPDSVIFIGGTAFARCSALSGINIPAAVTAVGEGAFDGCYNLTAVYITDLESWCDVDFSYSTWYITANPLYYAKNLYLNGEPLTQLTVPETVGAIKAMTFIGGNFQSVSIPESVTSIGAYAFHNCANITAVSLPSKVDSLGSHAFASCTALARITLPDSLVTLGEYALCNTALEEISIPGSVRLISEYAFYSCDDLRAVRIGEGTEQIGAYAFSGCSDLAYIVIPQSLWSIVSNAVPQVWHVLYAGTEEMRDEEMIIAEKNAGLVNATWHYGADASSIVRTDKQTCSFQGTYTCTICADTCWTAREPAEHSFSAGVCTKCGVSWEWSYSVTPAGITLTDYAGYADVIVIPETIEGIPVVSLGNYALAHGSFSKVYIPQSVTSIEYDAFYGCYALTDVYYVGTQEQWASVAVDSSNTCLHSATVHYDAQLYVSGDFDGNMAVNDADAIYLLRHTLFADNYPVSQDGDVNSDGTVNDADAIYLLRHTLFPDVYPLYPTKENE